MKSLGVIEFNSYGHGLAMLQEIYKKADLEVLEMIPVCGGLTLVLSGSTALMNETLKVIPREEGESLAIVENYNPGILRALYSLENAPIRTNLLILEGPFAGDLMTHAQRALENQIEIVEFKVPRGAVRSGVLLLSHENEKTLSTFRSAIGDGLTRVTLIRDIADGFQRYFDLAPKS